MPSSTPAVSLPLTREPEPSRALHPPQWRLSRRTVIAGVTGLAAIGGSLTWLALSESSQGVSPLPHPPATAQAVPVVKVGELAENEWKVFDFPDQHSQGIIINLPAKGLVAYSDVCTHLACALSYQGDGKHLSCPCHNGLFDATTGNVLAGPPPRPLPLILLAIHNGTIYAERMVPR